MSNASKIPKLSRMSKPPNSSLPLHYQPDPESQRLKPQPRKSMKSKGKLHSTKIIDQKNTGKNKNSLRKGALSHRRDIEEKENRAVLGIGSGELQKDGKVKRKKVRQYKDRRLNTIAGMNQYNSSRSESHSKEKGQSFSREKSKSRSKSRCKTSRQFESKNLKSDCMKSTKLVSEKSQFWDLSYKRSKHEKIDVSDSKPKKKEKRKKKRTEDNPLERQTFKPKLKLRITEQNQAEESVPSTYRKKHLRIKTEFSDRKASFFDEDMFDNLNIRCTESIEEENLYSTKPTGRKFKSNNFMESSHDPCDRKLFIESHSEVRHLLESSRRAIEKQTANQQIQTDRPIIGNEENHHFQSTNFQDKTSQSQLKNFKKIQSLRWKVMLLELNLLKDSQAPHQSITQSKRHLLERQNINKIDEMIRQSDSNRKQLISEAGQLLSSSKFANRYAFENPYLVQESFNYNSKMSSQKSLIAEYEQQNNIVQNISDKKLLKELEIINMNPIPVFDEFSLGSQSGTDNHNFFSTDRNFSEELEKQLDQYSSAAFGKIQQPKASNEQEIEMFELDIENIENKRLLSLEISDLLIRQVSEQIVSNKMFLHSFLSACLKDTLNEENDGKINFQENQHEKQNPADNQSFSELKIQCDKAYSVELLTRLLDFIQIQPEIKTKVMLALNTPLGNDPQKTLKWVREYYQQQEKDCEQQNEKEKPQQIEQPKQSQELDQGDQDQAQQQLAESASILTQATLHKFQTKNMNELIHEQYFYNHCVYNSINEILDSLRPYGASGKPCISEKILPPQKGIGNYLDLVAKVAREFIQIINLRIGRTVFAAENQGNPLGQALDPSESLSLMKKSYEILDRIAVRDQEQKWGNISDYLFENKYYLAEKIISDIFMDQCMMFFTEFLPGA